jgi:hypothetical protein
LVVSRSLLSRVEEPSILYFLRLSSRFVFMALKYVTISCAPGAKMPRG